MIAPNSLFEVPSANIDLTSKSSETVGSPASILATRDWLDLIVCASSTWVTPFACRRAFRPSASFSRNSIYISSWSESPSSSLALPTFQPLDSSFLRLLSRIFLLLQATPARCNNTLGRLAGLLGEHFKNHNSVFIDQIQDAPGGARVVDARLMAARPNSWHRPGLGHRQSFAALQLPKQVPCLDSRRLRHRWSLDLSMKPDQRFVFWAHT